MICVGTYYLRDYNFLLTTRDKIEIENNRDLLFLGTHHYYDMSRKLKCENVQPWFALTSGGSLIGTGFQMIGKLHSPEDPSEWFERGSASASEFGAKVGYYLLIGRLFVFVLIKSSWWNLCL